MKQLKMKKDNSIIIGSGVIGSYLAKFLLSKKQRIIVTSRKRKKSYTNYNKLNIENKIIFEKLNFCLLYTSPSPRDGLLSRMPSSA